MQTCQCSIPLPLISPRPPLFFFLFPFYFLYRVLSPTVHFSSEKSVFRTRPAFDSHIKRTCSKSFLSFASTPRCLRTTTGIAVASFAMKTTPANWRKTMPPLRMRQIAASTRISQRSKSSDQPTRSSFASRLLGAKTMSLRSKQNAQRK